MKKKNLIIAFTVVALFVIAFAIRLFLIQSQPIISEDGVAYARAGEQLIKGRGYFGIYPPFYPLMIGLFSLLFGGLELSARLVSVFYGSLLIIPLFFIARWTLGNKVAVISCLLVVIYPNLCAYSSNVLSESTFLFFFLVGLIVSWAAISSNKLIFYLLAGIIWGIAYLTRPEGLGYFILLAFIILLKFIRKRELRNIVYLCLLVFGFLIVSSPYLQYLKTKTGHWKLQEKSGLNLALGESVGRLEDWGVALDKCYFGLSENGKQLGYEAILEQRIGIFAYLSKPNKLIKRYIINLHLINKYVFPRLFSPIILILFGAGLFLGDSERTKKSSVLFLAFVPYLAFPFFIVDERYFVPFVPIILIWVARGIVEISRWSVRPMKDANIKVSWVPQRQFFIEGLIVIFVITSFVPFTFRPFLRNEIKPNIYKEIGEWMKSNLPRDAVLLCRKPWIPFYADKKQVTLPVASFDKVLKFAHYRKADYLIVDENDNVRPELGFLFEEKYVSKDLKLSHKFKDSSGKKIYVYQILN